MNQARNTGHSYSTYYLVKYLGLTCTITFILALINLWRWPAVWEYSQEGLIFLAVSIGCVLATKHRLVVVSAPLGLIALRGATAAALGTHPVESLLIAAIAAVLWFIVAKKTAAQYRGVAIPEKYSLREIGMDIVIMGPVLVLTYLLHEIV